MSDDISLVEYTPAWSAQAQDEIIKILSVLPEELVLGVEHVGSTAISGIKAKPILDIIVLVPSISQAMSAVPKIKSLGYQFWEDNPDTTKMFFVKGMPPFGSGRTHHIHFLENQSDFQNRILFRDYLTHSPTEAKNYETLKLNLAASFSSDREAYTNAKRDFIDRIVRLARANVSSRDASNPVEIVGSRFLLGLFAPLPAIILGAFAAHEHQISVTAFFPNFVGVIAGSITAWIIFCQKDFIKRAAQIISTVALMLLLTCFLSTGNEGVHRWISVGPFHLDISMCVSPLILFCLGISFVGKHLYSTIILIGLLAVHVFQPDPGQATAIGVALVAMLALSKRLSLAFRLFGIIVSFVAVTFTWRQPDPLLSVDHVERILHLISGFGSWGVVLMVLSTGLILFPIARAMNIKNLRQSEACIAGLGLAVYFVIQLFVTEFGNFPVPIFGAGISGVLGWYIIYGLSRRTKEVNVKQERIL